jgi:hypothetical protein
MFESFCSSLDRGVGIWNLYPSSDDPPFSICLLVLSALVDKVSFYGVATDLESIAPP